MWTQIARGRSTTLLGLGLVVVLAGAAAAAVDIQRQPLTATTSAPPKAHGRARLAMKSAASARLGIFTQRLPRKTTFDVVVNGVKVATLRTNGAGNGKVRLSTAPRGNERLLGFDPRGLTLAIRNHQGQDVLGCHFPGHPKEKVRCCVPSSVTGSFPDQPSDTCEEVTRAQCEKAGGTEVDADSCIPDPCGPPPTEKVPCCLPSSADAAFCDHQPEVPCEELIPAECAAAGGMVVDAPTCDPNPCTPVPPPLVACCVSTSMRHHDSEPETKCVLATEQQCIDHDGTVTDATSCEPDPCNEAPPPPPVVCCVPKEVGSQCAVISEELCSAKHGTVKTATSCEPDPCKPAPPKIIACCVQKLDEDGEVESKCVPATAAQCTLHHGTVTSATSCQPNPCQGDDDEDDNDQGDEDHHPGKGGPGKGDHGKGHAYGHHKHD
ncbi:MAG TPA: hypothetical protein VMS22_26130 [Candidatus Eisenbacteria bacterium]|nr:hypothetical protein [Candidatus Eisenbacteria bacterium]